MKTYIALAILGVIGVYLRYAMHLKWGALDFPWATLAVNVLGSFIIGALYTLYSGGSLSQPVLIAVGVGFLGALTTFSSYSLETLKLFEQGAHIAAFSNIGLNNVLGLLFCYLGTKLGTILQLSS